MELLESLKLIGFNIISINELTGQITWDGVPPENHVEAEVIVIQELRRRAYPQINDFLDAQRSELIGNISAIKEYYNKIEQINSQYPSPIEYPAKYLRIKDRKANSKIEVTLATQLAKLTPQQAVDYIEANVDTLATAKTILKIMVRILIALRDKNWPEIPEE